MDTPTIIGIGTARGGTQSLAYLLQQQGLEVGHEDSVSLDWRREKMPQRYARTLRYLRRTDGDVACWLTQAAVDLIEDLEDARVIAMLRDEEPTVESLVETLGQKRIRSNEPFGPMAFPAYEDGSLEEAWARYWQDYRQEVAKLTSAYPERTLCVEISEIEDEETQQQIAEFLGISEWEHVADCHKGKREER